MLAVIDYDAGNLYSVCNTLDFLGIPHCVTADPQVLDRAQGLILPGVGAFADAMAKLERRGLVEAIRENGRKKPLLGICLGMQILFETGYEFGVTQGLGLIPGTVERIKAPGLKIPHMGWNELELHGSCPFLAGVEAGDSVYFVHSYMAQTSAEYIAASCGYGVEIPALVRRGNIYGAQFHPEKSGAVGLRMLQNFDRLSRTE